MAITPNTTKPVPGSANNYFKGMKEAKFVTKYPYFETDQSYEVKLEKTYVVNTRDKGDAFIAEFEILNSSSNTQKPGTKVSFYQGITLNKETGFAAIKGLMYALLGFDPNNAEDAVKIANEVDPEIEDEMAKAVVENHMAGARVRCQTCTRVSKKTQKPYTVHNWAPGT